MSAGCEQSRSSCKGNMLFLKEGNVTALDMNGEIISGRIRVKMFGANTIGPENYLIAYKERGMEKIFFPQYIV